MSSASPISSINDIPADLFRHHIFPFIRNPTSFTNLRGVNMHFRRDLKETILNSINDRISFHSEKLKEIEVEITTDSGPFLTKDLHFAAISVNNIDFRTLSYGDADTLFVIAVFFEFLMLTDELPTKEEVEELFNKENAVENLEHVDPRCVSREVLDAAVRLVAKPEWKQAEARFTQGSEHEIITWLKLFIRYVQKGYEIRCTMERDDFHSKEKKRLRKLRNRLEKCWIQK